MDLDGYEDAWYHLTDAQFSSVALIDDTATIAERVTYTAYGEARHHWIGDVDGDGAVTTSRVGDDGIIADLDAANAVIGDANYRAEADINRDGVIDSADAAAGGTATAKAALAFGVLSDPAVDNQIGYDGYVFNGETLQYCVRFRTYDPGLGRWLERDPLGMHPFTARNVSAFNGWRSLAPGLDYGERTNLYRYGRSSPVRYNDQRGKSPQEAEEKPEEKPDPSTDPSDPRNDPDKGCGTTIKQNDLGNGFGHRWIEIDDPGAGTPGSTDYRPGRLRGLGCYPTSYLFTGVYYRSVGDPKDCDGCGLDDPMLRAKGDTTWGVKPRVPHGQRLRFGPGKGKQPSQATCEDFRRCLFEYDAAPLYLYGTSGSPWGGDCRSEVRKALVACGLIGTDKHRTQQTPGTQPPQDTQPP